MSPRTSSTDWVTTTAGDRFHLRSWPYAGETDTLVLIHHGLGEHGERYATFAEHLCDDPVDLWTYDARGHGESSGKRGHADGLDGLAADLEGLVPQILERSRATRIVLFGHSMGAAAVGHYLTSRSVHEAIVGVWMSAIPVAVDLSTLSMRVKAQAARVLSRVTPTLTLPSGLDPEGISSVPAEVTRYRGDPMIHDQISARLGLSLIRDAPKLPAVADRITLPILVWHGAEDPIANHQGSEQFHARVASTDKALTIVPDARHEVHHEGPEIVDALFASLRDWLQSHTST